MQDKLGECPFCGGGAHLFNTRSVRHKRGWYPSCITDNCPAHTMEQDEQGGTHFDYMTKEEAIAAWNNRPSQEGLAGELPDYIDLFRIIRRAGRSDADKAKAVFNCLTALRQQDYIDAGMPSHRKALGDTNEET